MRDITKYTRDYLNDDFEKVAVYYRRKKVLEILNTYKPVKILEIGCGTSSIFEFYHDYDEFTVVEPSKEFCETICKSEFYNNKITVINDFAENSYDKLKDKTFDFIIISSLIHELINPDILMQITKSLSNPNTIIHINVPNENSFHLLWAKEAGLIKSVDSLSKTAQNYQRHHTYNLDKLKKYCLDQGFSSFEEGSYFMKVFNNAKMLSCMNSDILSTELLDGLNKLTEYFPKNGSEIFVNCRIKN